MVLTQRPGYASEATWKNEGERFVEVNGLRFLRRYQKKAIVAIRQAVSRGSDRFLLDMATGTGKTLTSAAIIKLFLRTGNAQRVLFLVDRLELEDQALKAFKKILSNDYKAVIYKENRDDWCHAEIVVTTVQSLLFNNKYRQLFSPTDFDLVISDEPHRSIGGNARAVFDYFIGYKLGLTATPRDYLKNFSHRNPTTRDPREFERRILLDTYRTFGCDDGQQILEGVAESLSEALVSPGVRGRADRSRALSGAAASRFWTSVSRRSRDRTHHASSGNVAPLARRHQALSSVQVSLYDPVSDSTRRESRRVSERHPRRPKS